MEFISFFDEHHPVKTVFTNQADKALPGWDDTAMRKSILSSYIKAPVRDIFYAHETHSGSVFIISKDYPAGRTVHEDEHLHIRYEGGYDSLVTNLPGVMLGIWTADCLPLFLYDTKTKTIAMVHSGWRSTCACIAENTLSVMASHFSTRQKDVIAAIGPCIDKDCYEVGEELLPLFAEKFSQEEMTQFFAEKDTSGAGRKFWFDNRKAVTLSLLRSGIKAENIYDTGICTYKTPEFASYRRDGKVDTEKQMFSGIMLAKQ